MTPVLWGETFLAGAVASGLNTVAGGGSLLSYPFLKLSIGLPSVPANATNSVGLWPGSLGGMWGFRKLISNCWGSLRLLFWPTVVGSQVGAFLLLFTPSAVFDIIIPILILFAAGLLAFGGKLRAALGGRHVSPALGALLQFLVSVYGGYFGAGMGIMMLAAMSLYIEGTLHEHNALKNVLGLIINFSCSITFVIKGLVDYSVALPLLLGGLLGGYAAARISLKIDPTKLRVAVAIYGFLAAGYFFYTLFKPH